MLVWGSLVCPRVKDCRRLGEVKLIQTVQKLKECAQDYLEEMIMSDMRLCYGPDSKSSELIDCT